MVARTVAACSPPITEIRELGHMYRNLGLGKDTKQRETSEQIQPRSMMIDEVNHNPLMIPSNHFGSLRLSQVDQIDCVYFQQVIQVNGPFS